MRLKVLAVAFFTDARDGLGVLGYIAAAIMFYMSVASFGVDGSESFAWGVAFAHCLIGGAIAGLQQRTREHADKAMEHMMKQAVLLEQGAKIVTALTKELKAEKEKNKSDISV